MSEQQETEQERRAIEIFSQFLRDNRALLALVSRWGDGRCGKLVEIMQAELPCAAKPERKKREPKPVDPEDLRFARKMFARVLQVIPSAKEPKFETWADVIRRAREQDRRTRAQLWAVFEWANNDRIPRGPRSFCWAVNIRSPQTLREKYPDLEARMMQENGHGQSTATSGRPAGNGSRRSDRADDKLRDALGGGIGADPAGYPDA